MGWLNSQITIRPPGRVTLSSSARPALVSCRLRSPKEIVTASKLESANGSRQPVTGHEGQVRASLLADGEHALGEVTGDDEGTPLLEGERRGAGSGGQVEHPLPLLRVDRRDNRAAPLPVLSQREHVVGEVVLGGDVVEHLGHIERLLVEVGAGHEHEVCRHRGVTPNRGSSGRTGQ